jgi:hypothetical protein
LYNRNLNTKGSTIWKRITEKKNPRKQVKFLGMCLEMQKPVQGF